MSTCCFCLTPTADIHLMSCAHQNVSTVLDPVAREICIGIEAHFGDRISLQMLANY